MEKPLERGLHQQGVPAIPLCLQDPSPGHGSGPRRRQASETPVKPLELQRAHTAPQRRAGFPRGRNSWQVGRCQGLGPGTPRRL